MNLALRNEKADLVELDILETVGSGGMFGSGISAGSVGKLLAANQRAKTIRVTIHSRGGDVLDGLAIFAMLAQHPARVVVDIVGIAASIASYIAMAGTERRMAPGSLLMVHNPWGVGVGEAEDLRALADVLDKMQGVLARGYALRSGNTLAKVTAWMNEETYFTPAEAVAHGFADTITSSSAPPSAKAERKAMQPTPIVPTAVARAGLTSRYAELAAKIVAERDLAKLEQLLAERDALIRQAEQAPQAGAQATGGGKRWHELKPLERHRLLDGEPTRAKALKAQHDQEIARLQAELAGATTRAQYATAHQQLARLQGIAP